MTDTTEQDGLDTFAAPQLWQTSITGKDGVTHDLPVSLHGGFSKRERAAIELRVPMSGNPKLNAMIEEYWRRVYAGQALQGMCSNPNMDYAFDGAATDAYRYADAMIAERDKGVSGE